ncbi:low molecular weight protein-tyrosine-phosphatase [Paenibacillus beijingensis]|uniref:protein-tyrosine-phosphatase n=1 Tax=Paenibacillus beijingensis TaxID=1126833 RepID=A0A0D5NP53_9BACL|nr:low molecular weight protein-tyrosine-phosphatase [Paenibacillus beijingensis]AJY77056.1 hypothetical protein VN24_24015 [Paenibacillus beijingensis]
MDHKPVSVLFVCLGNICRSPMAEAVMRHLIEERGLAGSIKVDSAGTGDWHVGHPPHKGTRQLLEREGIRADGLIARQLRRGDLETFDYLVCMDDSNVSGVLVAAAKHGLSASGKVFKLTDLVPDKGVDGVPDPYYTGNFDEVYELVRAGCERLLERIVSESR